METKRDRGGEELNMKEPVMCGITCFCYCKYCQETVVGRQ